MEVEQDWDVFYWFTKNRYPGSHYSHFIETAICNRFFMVRKDTITKIVRNNETFEGVYQRAIVEGEMKSRYGVRDQERFLRLNDMKASVNQDRLIFDNGPNLRRNIVRGPKYQRLIAKLEVIDEQTFRNFSNDPSNIRKRGYSEAYRIQLEEEMTYYAGNYEFFIGLIHDELNRINDLNRGIAYNRIINNPVQNVEQNIDQIRRQVRNLDLDGDELFRRAMDIINRHGVQQDQQGQPVTQGIEKDLELLNISRSLPLNWDVKRVNKTLIYIDKTTGRETETRPNDMIVRIPKFECIVCYHTIPVTERVYCSRKEHEYCKTCLKKMIEEIVFSNVNKVSGCIFCPNSAQSLDQNLFDEDDLDFIDQKTLGKYRFKLMSKNNKDLYKCPFCTYTTHDNKDTEFQCMNMECAIKSCKTCKYKSHPGKTCEQITTLMNEKNKKNEKITESLLKKCPKCQVYCLREDGCGKMTCQCGKLFCWYCNKDLDVEKYSHFCGCTNLVMVESDIHGRCIHCKKCKLFATNKDTDIANATYKAN